MEYDFLLCKTNPLPIKGVYVEEVIIHGNILYKAHMNNLNAYEELQYIDINHEHIDGEVQSDFSRREKKIEIETFEPYTFPGAQIEWSDLLNILSISELRPHYDSFFQTTLSVDKDAILFADVQRSQLLHVTSLNKNDTRSWRSYVFLYGLQVRYLSKATVTFGKYLDGSLALQISGNGLIGFYDLSYQPPGRGSLKGHL